MTGTDPAGSAAGLLRDFVNTRDVEVGSDDFGSPRRLAVWLAARELVAPGTAAAPDDLRVAVALREGLRDVLLGHHGHHGTGPAPPSPALDAALDAALAGLPLRVTLDGGPRLVPLAGGAPVPAALARIGAAVVRSVTDGTWDRLKICPETTCRWAFLDTSKNRSRTWCSMRVCGNRTKTRAYRARQRTP